MKTDPRLLETLRRLATKGNPDTMPISLCPEGAALERIDQLDRENERMRLALEESTEWFEQLGRLAGRVLDDTTAYHLRVRANINRLAMKAALTSGDSQTPSTRRT